MAQFPISGREVDSRTLALQTGSRRTTFRERRFAAPSAFASSEHR